ncbi:hypothetical protein [Prevotella sp.]
MIGRRRFFDARKGSSVCKETPSSNGGEAHVLSVTAWSGRDVSVIGKRKDANQWGT